MHAPRFRDIDQLSRAPSRTALADSAGCPCSAIVHPHILIPRSLLRTPSALCITADLANGGNLFVMVRRARDGLPAAAAAFLFQQLTVTAHFGMRHGLWLHLLPPSKLLVAWNEKAMPIVKVNAIGYTWPRGDGDACVDAHEPQTAADEDTHVRAEAEPAHTEVRLLACISTCLLAACIASL